MTVMLVTKSFVERSVLMLTFPVPLGATLPTPVCDCDTLGLDRCSSIRPVTINAIIIATTTRTSHEYFLGYVSFSTVVIARSSGTEVPRCEGVPLDEWASA